jgi:spore germination cell wall hydrolase CwlJ-like protein
MKTRLSQPLLRADRILGATLAIVLATASAAVSAAATYNPHTDEVRVTQVVENVVKTVVTPVATPISRKERSDIVLAQLLAEHRCLAEAMYYEARGEGENGEEAVAEVIFHRMRNGNYGHSICAVVYEGAGAPGCQFSFACNGVMAEAKEPEAWRTAQILAARILTEELPLADTTGNATHYHAVSVQPYWSSTLPRTVKIGNHIFYGEPTRLHAM